MSWMLEAVTALRGRNRVWVQPRGRSMAGVIEDNERVHLEPIADDHRFVAGQVVFITWKGSYLLHLVREVADNRLLIANHRGRINGWVNASAVLGWCPDRHALGSGTRGRGSGLGHSR